jgi:hypothetical protein
MDFGGIIVAVETVRFAALWLVHFEWCLCHVTARPRNEDLLNFVNHEFCNEVCLFLFEFHKTEQNVAHKREPTRRRTKRNFATAYGSNSSKHSQKKKKKANNKMQHDRREETDKNQVQNLSKQRNNVKRKCTFCISMKI